MHYGFGSAKEKSCGSGSTTNFIAFFSATFLVFILPYSWVLVPFRRIPLTLFLCSLVLAYFSLCRVLFTCPLIALSLLPLTHFLFALFSLAMSYVIVPYVGTVLTLAPSGSFSVQFCVKAQSSEMDLFECGINRQVYLKGRGAEVFRKFCPPLHPARGL
jgi:hypothetical protein